MVERTFVFRHATMSFAQCVPPTITKWNENQFRGKEKHILVDTLTVLWGKEEVEEWPYSGRLWDHLGKSNMHWRIAQRMGIFCVHFREGAGIELTSSSSGAECANHSATVANADADGLFQLLRFHFFFFFVRKKWRQCAFPNRAIIRSCMWLQQRLYNNVAGCSCMKCMHGEGYLLFFFFLLTF